MRMRKEVFILSIDDILPNRFQPRIKFDEKAILELAESIKKHGVIQPIIVRKISDKYEIIAGERRYKASVIAGRKTIPAIITDVDDKESAEIALIENVQRQDMTPIEEAISYKKILDMGYLNQSELALKLGKTQSTIANKLRLLNLSDEVQEALLDEKISERHARSLLRLQQKDQKDVLNKIITERLTVRKTDQLINQILSNDNDSKNNQNSEKIITKNNQIIEEKGDNMNNENNNINNSFNIPTNPIIENESNSNPGFMNISDIENNAQDINNNPQPQNNPFNPFGNSQPFNPFMQPTEQPIQQMEQQVEPQQFNEPIAQENNQMEQPFNPFMQPLEQPTQQMEQQVEPQQFNKPIAQENNQMEQPFNPFMQPLEQPTQQMEQSVEPQQFNEPIAQENNQMEQPFNPFMQPVEQPIQQMEQSAEPQQFNEPIAQENNQMEQPFNPFMQPTEQPTQQMEQPFNSFVQSTPIYDQSYSDYPLPEDKELTPLMPNMQQEPERRADLRTVINIIRDCTNSIEAMGYKIDVDELDFENTYEFSIKIEKE